MTTDKSKEMQDVGTSNVNHVSWKLLQSWQSGYCDLNKGERDLNQSKDDSFVKRVAKNNN